MNYYNRKRNTRGDDWRNVERNKRRNNYTAHNTGSAADYNIRGSQGKKLKATGYIYKPDEYPAMIPLPKSSGDQIRTENRYSLLEDHDSD